MNVVLMRVTVKESKERGGSPSQSMSFCHTNANVVGRATILIILRFKIAERIPI